MTSLRSFNWKGVGVFFGFAAALSLWTWCGVLFANKELAFTDQSVYFVELFQRALLNYFPAYVLVGLADGLPLRGVHRKAALILGWLVGIALSVQVRCAVNMNEIFWAYDAVQLPYCTAVPTWRTYLDFPGSWMSPLTISAVVMVAIFTRRKDLELVESLHRVQSEEIDARRQRVESQIDAMQARVDPDKLVETLRAVRNRYEKSLDDGEAMLENLIDDLRVAARQPGGVAAE
jgi:hypothetical protein